MINILLFFLLLLPINVYAEPFIEVNILDRKLYLKEETDNKIIKEYQIGVSKSNKFMTPAGIYKVETKDKDPGWVNPFNSRIKIPPGKNNPLGTRWIGFHSKDNNTQVYGIHGTNQPKSVGKFVSHGCIRMLIKDSEDLFDRIEIGTKVKVIYQNYMLEEREGDLIFTLKEYPISFKPLELNSLKADILGKYSNAKLNDIVLLDIIENQKSQLGKARLIGFIK